MGCDINNNTDRSTDRNTNNDIDEETAAFSYPRSVVPSASRVSVRAFFSCVFPVPFTIFIPRYFPKTKYLSESKNLVIGFCVFLILYLETRLRWKVRRFYLYLYTCPIT